MDELSQARQEKAVLDYIIEMLKRAITKESETVPLVIIREDSTQKIVPEELIQAQIDAIIEGRVQPLMEKIAQYENLNVEETKDEQGTEKVAEGVGTKRAKPTGQGDQAAKAQRVRPIIRPPRRTSSGSS
jgi:hypothetical protein